MEFRMSKEQELHDQLAKSNIRIFKINLGDGCNREEYFFIHPSKDVPTWRKDLQSFINHSKASDTEDGWADSKVSNNLMQHLHNLGYIELDDVISDIYEGRIAVDRACIVDNPDHDEQSNGFGHYGWGSK